MSRSVPWGRILVEGVVIVASILLAFSIDAWWDGVQAKERATAATEEVRAELLANSPELDTVVAYHRRIYGAGLKILDVATGGSRPDSAFAEDASWVLSVEIRLDVATAVLDRVLSSGQSTTPVDPAFRDRLATYRNTLGLVLQQEEMIRKLVRDDLPAALSPNHDLLWIGTGSGSPEVESLSRSVIASSSESWDLYMLDVIRDPTIHNLIVARVGREYVALQRVERLKNQHDSLLASLTR